PQIGMRFWKSRRVRTHGGLGQLQGYFLPTSCNWRASIRRAEESCEPDLLKGHAWCCTCHVLRTERVSSRCDRYSDRMAISTRNAQPLDTSGNLWFGILARAHRLHSKESLAVGV